MKSFSTAYTESRKLVEALDAALIASKNEKETNEALDVLRVDLVIIMLQSYQKGRLDGIKEAKGVE